MRLGDLDALKDRFSLTGPIGVSVRRVIDEAPTIDAVPVVRCKDCKFFRIHRDSFGEDIPHCIKAWGGAEVDPMDFCSYGEQKGGEG